MWAPVFIIVCVIRVTCLLRRFMQKQTIEYTTASADSAPSTYFGAARVSDNRTCAVEDLDWFGTQPTEIIKRTKNLDYSLGFAVARSDRFTGYQPYLASSRYYPESSSLLRVRFVTGTLRTLCVSFRPKTIFTRLPQQ